MNEEHRELLEDLRALASDGPREAPGHVEAHLRTEFRRRIGRRRAKVWGSFAAVAAMAAGIALLAWVRELPKPVGAALVTATRTVATEEEVDASFYPLPEAEALPAMENAMVVRVQMPVSSLQLMGFPVSEEMADASVQADLLVGQDGLARAVRLAE